LLEENDQTDKLPVLVSTLPVLSHRLNFAYEDWFHCQGEVCKEAETEGLGN